MQATLRDSLDMIADPHHLDASVGEVFRLMLGIECRRETRTFECERESVTAVVGFGGALSGACILRCGRSVALEMTAHMTGASFSAVDDTVKDAIGEICNMLAGAWKGRIPQLAAHCGLSVPAVITGQDYNLHVQSPEFQIRHLYRFADVRFEVTILCDRLHG